MPALDTVMTVFIAGVVLVVVVYFVWEVFRKEK